MIARAASLAAALLASIICPSFGNAPGCRSGRGVAADGATGSCVMDCSRSYSTWYGRPHGFTQVPLLMLAIHATPWRATVGATARLVPASTSPGVARAVTRTALASFQVLAVSVWLTGFHHTGSM